MSPLPGTPAYRAGIRAGDIIVEINGKSTKGFTIDTAIHLLKGKPGDAVKIGVRHPGEDKIEQVTVVRDIIHVADRAGRPLQAGRLVGLTCSTRRTRSATSG